VVVVLDPLIDGIGVCEILNKAFSVNATYIDFDGIGSLEQTALK
jgi:hypothetical protein